MGLLTPEIESQLTIVTGKQTALIDMDVLRHKNMIDLRDGRTVLRLAKQKSADAISSPPEALTLGTQQQTSDHFSHETQQHTHLASASQPHILAATDTVRVPYRRHRARPSPSARPDTRPSTSDAVPIFSDDTTLDDHQVISALLVSVQALYQGVSSIVTALHLPSLPPSPFIYQPSPSPILTPKTHIHYRMSTSDPPPPAVIPKPTPTANAPITTQAPPAATTGASDHQSEAPLIEDDSEDMETLLQQIDCYQVEYTSRSATPITAPSSDKAAVNHGTLSAPTLEITPATTLPLQTTMSIATTAEAQGIGPSSLRASSGVSRLYIRKRITTISTEPTLPQSDIDPTTASPPS